MKTLFILLLLSFNINAADDIKMSGELRALNTDNFSPPRVKNVWQYTVSYMADDGSVVKAGMPVLMFKTDVIQNNLNESKGELGIKESQLKNNKALDIEMFEKKLIDIEEKKMELEKAARKAELPKSVLAQNDYKENQLNHELAQYQYDSALKDFELSKDKAKTEERIINAEIKKLKSDIEEYTNSIKSMKMFAKAPGIVLHKTNWQGEKYAVGDSIWGNRRVVEVANLNKIIARLEVTENNIKHVKNNQLVTVKLDALPDVELKGTIQSISKVVRVKSKNQPSKILEAIVHFEETDSEIMRPGMRLTAFIKPDNSNNQKISQL
ncbi:MAG: HlyD family secretion protein [Marinicellaceae bacterium]